MRFSFLVFLPLLFLSLSCTQTKTKENSTETIVTGLSSGYTPPVEDYAIVGGFKTGDTLSRARTEEYLLISIEKDEHADFTGIQRYKNLRRLSIYLWETSDVDFSPLKSLSTLRSMDLMGRALTELPDLSGIPYLTYLSIDRTSLTDLNGLEKIPQLEFLSVREGYKPLTDTSALRYMKKLKNLMFSDVSFTIDFNDLKDLPELEFLHFSNYGELDLTGIDQLSQIKKLEFFTRVSKKTGERSVFRNIEEIGQMTELKDLYINVLIASVGFLANNVGLERLELIADQSREGYTEILPPLDIAPIGNLKKLKYLAIRGFKLQNDHVLDTLPELEGFTNDFYQLE
jgi:internalin A